MTSTACKVELILDGYDALRRIHALAVEQATDGKGKERHASDKPFDEQPIMSIQDLVGAGFALGQATKKTQEARRLARDKDNGGVEKAKADLLGAMNYLAAAYLYLEKNGNLE